MYIVIGGGGVLGAALGEALVRAGHEVAVIELSNSRCEQVLEPLGVVPFPGSATEISLLERAGIRKADVAVGLMGRDADNLAFCLLCRHLQVPRVMSRLLDDRYRAPLEIAGATLIFSEVAMVLGSLQTSIELPEVMGLMKIRRGELAVFEMTLPVDSRVANWKIRDVVSRAGFPSQCLFVGIADRSGKVAVPTGATPLEGGNSVIVVCSPRDVRSVVAFLGERQQLRAADGFPQSIRGVLREMPFLAPMSDEEIELLARRSHVDYVSAGSTLFRQGDTGNEMYVLCRGRVRLERDIEGKGRRPLVELAAPDFFGEMAVLTGRPRSADAVVLENAELIVIDQESLQRVLMSRPDAMIEVTNKMQERTRENRDVRPPSAAAARPTSESLLDSVSRMILGQRRAEPTPPPSNSEPRNPL